MQHCYGRYAEWNHKANHRFRMLGYKEMVEKNNPSEEERVEALCSVADAIIGIATHVKDKMPNIEFVFNENGETVAKNIWLEKNDSTED